MSATRTSLATRAPASREAALRAGVPISDLASSWAAFTVHAALFCRPGGRLGLVLPAELLSVNYAAGVRRFLMERFATVRLVLFTERVFPGVLEEVVLLLAEGYGQGPAGHCELVQARNAERPRRRHRIPDGDRRAGHPRWTPEPIDGKWTSSLLSTEATAAYAATADRRRVHRAADLGRDHAGHGHREQQVLRAVRRPGPRARAARRGVAAAVPAGFAAPARADLHRRTPTAT